MMAALLYGTSWPVALPRSSVPMSILCALSGQIWYKQEYHPKSNHFLPVTFHILGESLCKNSWITFHFVTLLINKPDENVRVTSVPEVITRRCHHNQEVTYICDLIFIAVGQGLATSLWVYLLTIMCAFGMCWMENAMSNIGFLHQLWKLVVKCCMC